MSVLEPLNNVHRLLGDTPFDRADVGEQAGAVVEKGSGPGCELYSVDMAVGDDQILVTDK